MDKTKHSKDALKNKKLFRNTELILVDSRDYWITKNEYLIEESLNTILRYIIPLFDK